LSVRSGHPVLAAAAGPDAAFAALSDRSPEDLREATASPRRIGWAHLLARVFAVDVTVCPKCGRRMKALEVVTDPNAIAKLLYGARAPPRPCPPGQLQLFV